MDTVKLDEYLRSPCMASSLPYWKAQKTVIPDNMMIIRDDAFLKDKYTEYKDSPYFKLIHRLKHLEKHIEKPVLSKRFSLCTKGIDAFAQHIQECYGDGEVTVTDYIKIRRHILGYETLEDAYLKASDADDNGKTDMQDYIIVRLKLSE